MPMGGSTGFHEGSATWTGRATATLVTLTEVPAKPNSHTGTVAEPRDVSTEVEVR